MYASGRNHVVKPLIQEATHLLGRMVDVHMYYLGKENFGAHPLLDRKEVFRNSFVLKKYLILFSKTKAWNWIILLTGHSAAADFSGRASHSAYAANIAFIVTYIHCLYNYIYYLCKWKKWVLGIIFESLARVFFAFWKKSHSFVRKSSTGFSISRVLCCRTLELHPHIHQNTMQAHSDCRHAIKTTQRKRALSPYARTSETRQCIGRWLISDL